MSESLNTPEDREKPVRAKLVVAGVGGVGPNATAINFQKDADGVREWGWVPNEIAADVRAGTVVYALVSRSSKVETTYTDKTGQVVALKVPKRQLFFGGETEVDAPESVPLPPTTWKVTDKAKVYAARVDAKQVAAKSTETSSGAADEPF
jgi:hypothetical protein